MRRSVVIGWLAAVITGGALIFAGISFFDFLTSSGGNVEGLDKLVARVDEAAKLGHVAPGLEIPVCQADNPLHIGALVHDFYVVIRC